MRFRFDAAELASVCAQTTSPLVPTAITFGRSVVAGPPCPNHYVVTNVREAYRRVLWSNPSPGYSREKDLLGATGHLERANAWTHVVGCVLFCGYGLVRIWMVDQHSLSSQLSGMAINLAAVMFATSVMYHIFGTVPGCSGYMRNLDITAIYMSMGVSGVAEAAMVTNDFEGVSAQCIADPLIAVSVLGAFFTVRRLVLPSDETHTDQFEESCQLGLYRFVHSDLEHAALRTGAITALTFFWVLLLPAAFENLSPGVAALYLLDPRRSAAHCSRRRPPAMGRTVRLHQAGSLGSPSLPEARLARWPR